MKQYVGFSRDHSSSMSGLASSAKKDYNLNIDTIKSAALKEDIDTIVSVVECGYSRTITTGGVRRAVVNSSVSMLKPLEDYPTPGYATPLFDSVNELISVLSTVPDADDPNVSFLIMVITDGEENSSKISGLSLAAKINQLQKTDRWTFTFRVPSGSKRRLLLNLPIPEGNVQEWEQTERGYAASTDATTRSVTNYFTARSTGLRSTSKFYADAADINTKQLKQRMTNISSEVRIFPVPFNQDGIAIKGFVDFNTKKPLQLGQAFYQLSKPEKAVQGYKVIVIRDKDSGEVYAGQSARDLLGIPSGGTISLNPGDFGKYEIFIQSTSTNRKLVGGTSLLLWENAVIAR